MPKFVEVIFNPDKFFRDAKEERMGFLPAISVIVIAVILGGLTALIIAEPYSKATVEFAISQGLPPDQAETIYNITYMSMIISSAFGIVIAWVIYSILLHGISAIFGGKGDISTTFKFTAFSFLPTIVLFPLSIYISLETVRFVSVYGYGGISHPYIKLTTAVVGTISLIWQMTLWTFGVKNARELSLRNAFIVSAIPAAILLILTWYSYTSKILM